MLAARAASVPMLGHKRVKPSVYLRPIAQATSSKPAITKTSQAVPCDILKSSGAAMGLARRKGESLMVAKSNAHDARLAYAAGVFSLFALLGADAGVGGPRPPDIQPLPRSAQALACSESLSILGVNSCREAEEPDAVLVREMAQTRNQNKEVFDVAR